MPCQTVSRIEANKPDIVLFHKEKTAIYVIEFSAPFDSNSTQKYNEKISTYHSLKIELKRMYPHWKVKICPLIFGALGAISGQT